MRKGLHVLLDVLGVGVEVGFDAGGEVVGVGGLGELQGTVHGWDNKTNLYKGEG